MPNPGEVAMAPQAPAALVNLHESDETAWLDQSAELLRSGRFDELDAMALAEYLTDMARRDRREVFIRLVIVLSHLLKWEYQPDRRSGSWLATILEQQRELRQLLDGGTLRNHALSVFAEAYAEARKQAAAETELARAAFPEESPWDLEGALTDRGENP